ncbi:cassette chromosome recombinase B [Proteobacteria bacterium CAG:495]|nr:cassette chromosome recombinase B [Proteobacteria bacterium CAG:495]
MKAVIFTRVSTREQQEDGFSLPAQIDRLTKYCQRKDLEILETFTIIESSTRGGRPEFHKMLDFIREQKEPIALVCDKVDRLQRSFKDVPILEELRKSGKIVLHFNVEGQVLDANANSSQIMAYQMFVMMAKAYTNNISDNVKRSIEQKLRDGTILGNAPVGYLNVGDEKNKDVIFDPDRAHIIKKLFEEYATGLYSLKDMTKRAKALGLRSKTKKGGYLSLSQVHNMLRNPFYYGMMLVKGELHPHIYKPLIERDLFMLCQDVMKGRKEKHAKPKKHKYILRQLIVCKCCGRMFTPETKKGKYVYLRPNPLDDCDKYKNISEDYVLDKIKAKLKDMALDDDFKEGLLAELKKVHNDKVDYSEQTLKSLRGQHDRVQSRLDRLTMLLLDESITKDEHDKTKMMLMQERAEVKSRMENLAVADDRFTITMEHLIELSSRAGELFESSGTDEKRQIINFIFSNLELEGKNLVFTMREPFYWLSKLSTRTIWLPHMDSNHD